METLICTSSRYYDILQSQTEYCNCDFYRTLILKKEEKKKHEKCLCPGIYPTLD